MNIDGKRELLRKLFGTSTHGSTGTCHCGVMHYDAANFWDDDHQNNVLPSAEAAAKASPKDYQFHGGAISYVRLAGAMYVIGCRCETDELLLGVLNEDRQKVLQFLKHTQDTVNVNALS